LSIDEVSWTPSRITMSDRNIAIVGAGSLGQPFGYYLNRGDAEITYVVKQKYAADARDGFTLHEWGVVGSPTAHSFSEFDVVVDYEDLERHAYDQLWLCLPSPAIRGDWLDACLEAVGSTTLVSIQPGLRDRDHLEAHYPADRIVSARASLVAYPAPLPGEDLPEGDVAFIRPPGERIWVGGGARDRNNDVADALRAGGCPSGVRTDVRAATLRSGAVMETAVAGLELADWQLTSFRGHPAATTAADAAREALEVVAEYTNTSVPLGAKFAAGRTPLSWGLSIGHWLAPFNLEAYLERHFTKVGDQTRAHLDEWIALGHDFNLTTEALESLRTQLKEHLT
jgi:2-dehydropantoate 2-reductase